MKSYFIFILSLFTFTSYSQNINIFVLNKEDCNLVSSIKEFLDEEFDINSRYVKSTIIQLPDGEFIDSDKLNKKLTGRTYFSYESEKSINIYLTKEKLIWKDLKVNGISYGNNIYLSYLRKDKVKIVLTHELAHTFGAPHCDNECIMNNDYTPNYPEKIWDPFLDKPIFCKSCNKYW